MDFWGRETELQFLEELFATRTAKFLIIKGRRRVGKSRLVEEFGKNKQKQYYSFLGLPPDKDMTAQKQREEFARKLSKYFKLPPLKANDWADLFDVLAEKTTHGKVVILLDEISWMAKDDPTFLGKIKNVWDEQLKRNPKLMLILCSSVSNWIEKNILSSTGFVGRVSHVYTLKQLPLNTCNQFWKKTPNISAYEKLKMLSITGGVPLYLESIEPHYSAEKNIHRLCFTDGALLVRDFKDIFSDIFSTRTPTYLQIVRALLKGPQSTEMISQKTGIAQTGLLSEYLHDLCHSGFIRREYTWLLPSGQTSKLSHYRLSDNYLRFYLKYIEPNLEKIENNRFSSVNSVTLPGWQGILGLQFENLVVNNGEAIIAALGLKPEEIVMANPFFQRHSTKTPGCQIDYMIQTRQNGLYVCEIKFHQNEIKHDIIDEVEAKIKRLKRPKGFSCFPVLIHVNGVSDSILESEYFTKIIDFSDLLKQAT